MFATGPQYRIRTLIVVSILAVNVPWVFPFPAARATENKNSQWKIEKSSVTKWAQAGGTVTYVITVTRLGGPVTGAKVADVRDGNYTSGYGTPSDPNSATAGNGSDHLEWELPPMNTGDTWTVTYSVQVRPGVPAGAKICNYLMVQDGTHLSGDQTVTVGQTSANLTAGANPGAQSTEEPINAGTGEYYTGPIQDLRLGGPLPLTFRRYYAAGLWEEGAVASLLGANWMHNFDVRVRSPGAWERTVVFERGKLIRFQYLWGGLPGVNWGLNFHQETTPFQLRGDETGPLWLLDPVRELVYFFGGDGLLQAILDRNENRLTVTRVPGTAGVAQVTDGLGRTLSFSYTAGLLTGVSDGSRQVLFEYDTRGYLGTVTDPLGRQTLYTYHIDTTHGPLMTTTTRPNGNKPATQTFNASGQVTRQVDALGNATAIAYDTPLPGQTGVTHPDGGTVMFTHEDRRLGTEVRDQTGHFINMEFDDRERVTAWHDRLGDITSLAYHDESGKIAAYTDAAGNTTAFTYEAQPQSFTDPATGRTVTFTFYNLVEVAYADGRRERFTYDARGNVLTRTDQKGQKWSFTYNGRGQLLTRTNPTGGVTTHTYNSDATLASGQDSETGVTRYDYDDFKRLRQITRPDGRTVSFAYDLADRLLSYTDERGKTIGLAYDKNGNLTSRTNPLKQTTTYGHDLMDRVTSWTDALGHAAKSSYDASGRVRTVTDRNGNTTTYGYDLRGWPTGVTDRAGHTWTTTYDDEGVPTRVTSPTGLSLAFQTDKLGRATRITDAAGATATFAYDQRGRLTAATDRLGRATTYAYDAAGGLTSVTQPLIGTATYTRNALGRLTRIRDLRGQSWDFGYSAMGRRTSGTDPLGNRWTYAYDTRGRLQKTTYPGGTTATLTYDAAGHVTRIAYSGGPTLDFTYDDAGRLLTAGDLKLTYDARGDITKSQDGTASFGATYDNGRRLATATYDGQTTVTYAYDSRNLLTRVSDSLSGAWMEFRYDADGRLVEARRSNNVTTTYTYNNVGRLTRLQDGMHGDQQYTLNAEGEVKQAAMNVPLGPATVGYAYDAAGRLTGADYGGGNRLSYAYDPAGNLTNVTGKTPLESTARANSLSYDNAAQVSSSGYKSDSRGRLTTAPGRTFAYDGAGRLTSITGGGSTATLAYNGLGDLRTRATGGVTTTYYHNYALGLSPIVAQKQGASYQRFYVYTPGGHLLYSVDAGTKAVRFYHFDRLGTTLFLTDGLGAVTDSYAHDPYGVLLGHTGMSDQPFTFAGCYGVRWEPAANLYHMRARYYDATTARFLTRDPLRPTLRRPQSLNPCQYAAQNPLRYVDPRGTDPHQAIVDQGWAYLLLGPEFWAWTEGQGPTHFGAVVGPFVFFVATGPDPLADARPTVFTTVEGGCIMEPAGAPGTENWTAGDPWDPNMPHGETVWTSVEGGYIVEAAGAPGTENWYAGAPFTCTLPPAESVFMMCPEGGYIAEPAGTPGTEGWISNLPPAEAALEAAERTEQHRINAARAAAERAEEELRHELYRQSHRRTPANKQQP